MALTAEPGSGDPFLPWSATHLHVLGLGGAQGSAPALARRPQARKGTRLL